uniref:Vps72/YL1 C-terminal domain-containing protein n=1 Tax=Corethron hystrix TaxID=216773 RepID=A0A7S1BTJ0_9STRA|mmetsp:Transcript_40404/g.94936  ORF Transcript_40404/g.94936 Transcript_40404/m.94936 type:complete len:273 (+) Transcript_40404:88-906(+)
MTGVNSKARQAWNLMMRSTAAASGAGLSSSATSSAVAVTKKRGQATAGPSSETGAARKKKRSDRARKKVDTDDSEEGRNYRDACRVDMLEDVVVSGSGGGDDDDEYDEFFGEKEENEKKTGTGRGSRRGKASSAASNANGSGSDRKYLRPRSLASLLIEESSSRAPDDTGENVSSVLAGYLTAEARVNPTSKHNEKGGRTDMDPICPVTGLMAIYRDTKVGGDGVHRIGYATLEALEHMRERLPPWCNPPGGGAYYEAVESLRDDLGLESGT